MHHRWRARAVDLARRRARASRRSTSAAGTGDLALELRRRVGRAGGRRPRLLRADARAGAREGAGAPSSACRATRSSCRSPTRRSTRRRSASARATSPTSSAASREMARVVRPGGRVVILEITTPQRPPLSWFFRLWFDRIVPVLGPARRRLATPTRTCRARCAASRPRRAGRAADAPAGLRDVRWVLTGRRASSRSTPATGRVNDRAGTARRRARRRRRRMLRRCSSAPSAARARSPTGTAPSWRATATGDAVGRRQAAAAAARVPLRRRRRATSGSCAAAAAVELLHMATLVHDDVLDRGAAAPRPADGLRRAAAGCAATATGDLLFSRAFAVLAANGERGRRSARCRTPVSRSPAAS